MTLTKLILIATLGIFPHVTFAQGMAVNTSGAAANSSAILDASSTTQGLLVPRMTTVQKRTISSPATGLLVYQTDSTQGFYYYTGSSWLLLNSTVATAGGDLTGTYPNPTIANGAVTGAKIANNTITTTNLPAGASASTYLRGDNTWATPSGGGGGGGSIGGGIVVNTLPQTTSAQNYTMSGMGSSNRLFLFDETNNSFWTTAGNFPTINIDLGAASSYTAGTIISFRVIRVPGLYGNGPHWNFTSSGAAGFFAQNLFSTTSSWSTTYYQVTLISDGVSKWYASPY